MTAPRLFAAAAVASALFAMPAMAQDTTPPADPTMPTEPIPADTETMPPAAEPAPIPVDSPTAAADAGMDASTNAPAVTTRTVTNGPVPDTAENRAKYGSPMSNAGKRTKPAGN